MRDGYFIAVEGCDYAGKSTLVAKLCKLLTEAGYDVVNTRQPGGTPLAEELRDTLKRPRDYEISPVTEYLIFQAARSDLVHSRIKPSLSKGKIVISDRHDGSTFAYQSLVVPEVSNIASIEPDLTIFMDRKPKDLSTSIAERGDTCRIESKGIAYQHEIYNNYLTYISNRREPVISIDVNNGYDSYSYADGLSNILAYIKESDNFIRELNGFIAMKQFMKYFFEQTNIGIIPVGSPVNWIPSYDTFPVTVDSTDEEIDNIVVEYLGTCHKWKRNTRPNYPIRIDTEQR